MSRFPMGTFQQDAILKRLSQALVALEVSNVKTLNDDQCKKLQCGDIVVKKDSAGEHAYVVTFKKDGVGMCLTYTDASVVETQSYDYTDGHWVYNSEDKTDIILSDTPEGTISKVLGLDSGGNVVKGDASGENEAHAYRIMFYNAKIYPLIVIYLTSDDNLTVDKLKAEFKSYGYTTEDKVVGADRISVSTITQGNGFMIASSLFLNSSTFVCKADIISFTTDGSSISTSKTTEYLSLTVNDSYITKIY